MTDQSAELAAEQAHLDTAYARLDDLRRAAQRVVEGYAEVGAGGTHQARLERDAAAAHTRRRLAALEIGDQPLCFGRLDLADPDQGAVDGRTYIGRLSVADDDQQPLVVDWRAPVAEPFYRATPLAPMGVVRRRHFQTHGRRLVGIDDELFDGGLADESGLTVVGEGALLRALGRDRTGRMHDIVATIQAEQDEAIRSDLAGALLVTGGPGTGKTAVALHRAAYLLYTHRQRLASRGVLVVGPTPVFLRYIDEVLPSLGEDEVQLSTITALKPQLRIAGSDPAPVTALKGDARLARVIANALRDRQHPLRDDLVVTLDGFRLVLSRGDSRRIVERVRHRRGTHNERRPQVVRAVLDHLKRRYRRAMLREFRRGARATRSVDEAVAAVLARGEPAPDDWEHELDQRLRHVSEVAMAVERMWPVLEGGEVVRDLFGFEALVRSAADGILTPAEQRLLLRDRGPSLRDVPWTEADVPLVDEADALLGSPHAARPRRRAKRTDGAAAELAQRTVESLGVGGFLSARDVLERYGTDEVVDRDGSDGEARTFGHVVVDEAQDLTAMQWRMLARRCPTGSMTIVGDLGQASRPGALRSWDDVLAELPRPEHARRVELTVNYRTPAEIMGVAGRVLAAAAPGVAVTRSVRESGEQPRFVATEPGSLVDAVTDATARARAVGGTVAVIAPGERHEPLVAALDEAKRGPEAIDAPVAVLGPFEAKGLEFDHVVVVEPAELVTPDADGLRMLYVVLTRATRTLTVVHARALPEALEPPSPAHTRHDGLHQEVG